MFDVKIISIVILVLNTDDNLQFRQNKIVGFIEVLADN